MISWSFFPIPGNHTVHGYAGDLTNRKLAEDKLSQLFQALEQSPVSVVITDTAGNIEYVNSRFIQLTG